MKAKNNTLSDYAKFHFKNLGFNLYHPATGRLLSKRGYFDRFNGKFVHGWEYQLWEPSDGWQNEAERNEHYKEVTQNRKSIQKLLIINQ